MATGTMKKIYRCLWDRSRNDVSQPADIGRLGIYRLFFLADIGRLGAKGLRTVGILRKFQKVNIFTKMYFNCETNGMIKKCSS
jgi:hypothetical protein